MVDSPVSVTRTGRGTFDSGLCTWRQKPSAVPAHGRWELRAVGESRVERGEIRALILWLVGLLEHSDSVVSSPRSSFDMGALCAVL